MLLGDRIEGARCVVLNAKRTLPYKTGGEEPAEERVRGGVRPGDGAQAGGQGKKKKDGRTVFMYVVFLSHGEVNGGGDGLIYVWCHFNI